MLTAASRPSGSACISAPERAATLDDLISVEISVKTRAGTQIPDLQFDEAIENGR